MHPDQTHRSLPALRIAVLTAAVAGLAVGCASTTHESAAKPRATLAQKPTSKSEQVRYVEVTGSRIPVKVVGDSLGSELPMNLVVMDMDSTMNQGYPTPLDAVVKNTWASPGIRGR